MAVRFLEVEIEEKPAKTCKNQLNLGGYKLPKKILKEDLKEILKASIRISCI